MTEPTIPTLYSTGVRVAIDKLMIEKSKERRDYGDYWSASSAGYCMRKVMFDRLKVPHTTEDARKQRVFEAGHIFHAWVQGVTKEAGISVAQEIELQDEDIMVRGHIDDLVDLDGHLILYDYKTVNSQAFHWARKANMEMSLYHRMQLGTYLYIMRKLGMVKGDAVTPIDTRNLEEARIMKLSKDDLSTLEEQLMWNNGLEKAVYGYWSTLNGYWKAQKLPKCTCAEIEPNQKTGIGFMADPKYNPYYFQGEPCSMTWYRLFKEGKTDEYLTQKPS